MKRGKLIVFEGADEVGKTTIATMLTQALRRENVDATFVAFPGYARRSLGWHIYQLHHDSLQFGVRAIDPTSLQILHIAAHIDTFRREVRPALEAGRVVVLDRFWWSAWIYGLAYGASRDSLKSALQAEAVQWGKITPSIVFLVTRNQPLERQRSAQVWKRISASYRAFAAKEGKRYPVSIVENESSPEDTLTQVRLRLKHLHLTQRRGV